MASSNTTAKGDSDCVLFPDQPQYCDTVVICKTIACSVSIIGSLFTLLVIVLLKKYKELTQLLIANLSFAAMLYAIFFIIMSDFNSKYEGLCMFQAAAITYDGWVILLSSMTILLNVYCGIILQKDLRKYAKFLIAICWTLPLVLAGLPFTDGAYGPAGAWCWITNRWQWRFGIWYIWKFLSDVIFFIGIIHIWCKLLRAPEERTQEITPAQRQDLYDDIRTLRLYPVVYFLIFLLPTIHRIYNAIEYSGDQTGSSFGLLLLHSITAPLFGAVVALTFVLDTKTRRILFQKGILDEIARKWRRTGDIQEYQMFEGMDGSRPTVA